MSASHHRSRGRRAASLLLVAAALGPFITIAAEAPPPADLRAAIDDYDRAQVAADRAALERLLADDYHLVNAAGRTQDKASFIADSTAPGFKLEPFAVRDGTISAWTDGAIATGFADLVGRSDGQAFKAALRFVDVWRRRDGRWQVIFTQTTHAGP